MHKVLTVRATPTNCEIRTNHFLQPTQSIVISGQNAMCEIEFWKKKVRECPNENLTRAHTHKHKKSIYAYINIYIYRTYVHMKKKYT